MRSAARLWPLAGRTLRITLVSLTVGGLLFLPFAGRFLVEQDPLQAADLIFVLAGARTERWMEGVELYRERWAPRIVVSPGPVDAIEADLHARGIPYPREGDLARDAIIASGVPEDAVTVLPNGVDNTAHEAAELLYEVSGGGLTRVIVVTSPYHTRRTAYAFRRALGATGVQVLVRPSRYSNADPARWWRRRTDVRHVLSELPKLTLYVAGVRE